MDLVGDKSAEWCRVAFQMGAARGHREGQHRAGSYVIGEEYELSRDADFGQTLMRSEMEAGYRYGYKLAAEGKELPK
jgi:hypothetical protein